MDSAPEFLNLFVEPTGELIYFLAVFAISQATMLMALGQRLRGSSEKAAGRYAALLGGVVLAWTAMGAGGPRREVGANELSSYTAAGRRW